MPMTLTQFIQACHRAYQGDVDYPESDDDEWTLWIGYLKDAIGVWDGEKGMTWNELWKAGSGTVSGTTLTLPSDFRFSAGHIRLGTGPTFYRLYTPEEAALYTGQSVQGAYITGNSDDGYTLNFMSTPTNGDAIAYAYYKTPEEPDEAAEVIEMSDPWFAVYYAVATKLEVDGEGDRATSYYEKAQAKLDGMKVRNAMSSPFQSNSLQDFADFDVGFGLEGGYGNLGFMQRH